VKRATADKGHTFRPFGWEWERDYLPQYVTDSPSLFHDQLIADLSRLHVTRGARLNYRGPRGSGKTSHISKAYPLWCALEGVERLILLLAETGEQATTYLKAIKAELETNAALEMGYPRVFGAGPVWRDDSITLRNGVTIVARGSKGRVLGLTRGATRPSLVIGDDLNERGDAYSPTMRRRKLEWFFKDVMKVGTPRTNVVVAGTSIHREAVVCELTRNPAFTTRRYASILEWPQRMDLWAKWESLYANLGDANRQQTARAFYDQHSIEMDAGVVLLWPSRYPLYDLMCDRAEAGPSAFASERQDEEGMDGATEWPASYFDRPDLWFHDWPDDLVGKAYYLDPSKGKDSHAGDYQAHVWGGWSRGQNALYVEADLRREPVTDMIGRAVDQAAAFGCGVTVETNATMGLILPEFQRQMDQRKKPVGLQGIANTDPKLLRIRGLGPLLSRGQIRVRNTGGGKLLVDQLRDVPSGEFDDGADGLAGLWRRVQTLVR
jgi:hypothetical protein